MLMGMSSKNDDAQTTVHVLRHVMDMFRARFKGPKKLKTIWTAAAWMALQSTEEELHKAYEAAQAGGVGLEQKIEDGFRNAAPRSEAEPSGRRRKAGGKGSAA